MSSSKGIWEVAIFQSLFIGQQPIRLHPRCLFSFESDGISRVFLQNLDTGRIQIKVLTMQPFFFIYFIVPMGITSKFIVFAYSSTFAG